MTISTTPFGDIEYGDNRDDYYQDVSAKHAGKFSTQRRYDIPAMEYSVVGTINRKLEYENYLVSRTEDNDTSVTFTSRLSPNSIGISSFKRVYGRYAQSEIIFRAEGSPEMVKLVVYDRAHPRSSREFTYPDGDPVKDGEDRSIYSLFIESIAGPIIDQLCAEADRIHDDLITELRTASDAKIPATVQACEKNPKLRLEFMSPGNRPQAGSHTRPLLPEKPYVRVVD